MTALMREPLRSARGMKPTWQTRPVTTDTWTHADFPESTAGVPGMRVVDGRPCSRNVHVHLGLRYAAKDGRALHLVVAQPSLDWATGAPTAIAAERFPLVVFVQGSGWGEQSLGANLEPLASFARRGFVVAIVEYRQASLARFPAQIADTLTATRWLVDHAGDFGIDPDKVALWGDSSGGHTVVMAALTGGDPDFTDEPERPPVNVSAVVDFYGPVALDRMDDEPTTVTHDAPGSPETTLLGVQSLAETPDRVAQADPRTHLRPDRSVPPVLVVHGTKDRSVPFAQSVLLVEGLRAAGRQVEAVQVRGGGHGGPSVWTPQVLDIVDDFLRQHLS